MSYFSQFFVSLFLFSVMAPSNAAAMCVALCFVFATVMQPVATNIIVRPNVGVVFVQESDISITPTFWHHTIAIPLNFSAWLPNDTLACSPATSHLCTTIATLQQLYSSATTRLQDKLIGIHDDIIDLGHSTRSNPRTKRGWFDAIGHGAKTLFGLATNDDLKVLTKHIVQLHALISDNNGNRISDIRQLHSFQVHALTRMDHLADHLATVDEALVNMSASFIKSQGYIKKYIGYRNLDLINDTLQLTNWLSHYNVRLVSMLETQNVYQDLLHDVPHLMQGKLTPNVIHPGQLLAMLSAVDDNLQSINSTYHVACDTTYFYQQVGTSVATIHNEVLFIKLNIPITSTTSTFQVFAVDVLPVPGDIQNDVYTLIQGIAPYLLLSPDNATFLELSSSQKHRLSSITHSKDIIPQKVRPNVCILNIFFQIDSLIPETCKIQILHQPVFPHQFVYILQSNQYLLYTPQTQWTLDCPFKPPQSLSHRGLFKIELKCHCKLSSEFYEYSAFNPQCVASEHTVFYSSNFLIYESLYKSSITLDLKSSTFTKHPINFQLPPFIVDKAKLISLEHQDKDSDRSALQLFNISDQKLDHSRLQLLDWMDSSTGTSFITVSTFVLMVMNAVLFIAVLFLCFHQRQMRLLIPLATALQNAEAVHYTLPTPAVSKFPILNFNWIHWTCVLLALIFLCLCICIYLLYSLTSALRCQLDPPAKHFSQIHLYGFLWSPKASLELPLLSLPSVQASITSASLSIDKIALHCGVTGFYANFSWTKDSFVTPCGVVHLPKFYRLTLIQAIQFYRIIHSDHLLQIKYFARGTVYDVADWHAKPLQPYTCIRPIPSVQRSSSSTLYPDLPQSDPPSAPLHKPDPPSAPTPQPDPPPSQTHPAHPVFSFSFE